MCAQKKRELQKYDDYNAQNKYGESPNYPWVGIWREKGRHKAPPSWKMFPLTTTHDAYAANEQKQNIQHSASLATTTFFCAFIGVIGIYRDVYPNGGNCVLLCLFLLPQTRVGHLLWDKSNLWKSQCNTHLLTPRLTYQQRLNNIHFFFEKNNNHNPPSSNLRNHFCQELLMSNWIDSMSHDLFAQELM